MRKMAKLAAIALVASLLLIGYPTAACAASTTVYLNGSSGNDTSDGLTAGRTKVNRAAWGQTMADATRRSA
jgi:hypothetical protein